jgi:hypothetical protein
LHNANIGAQRTYQKFVNILSKLTNELIIIDSFYPIIGECPGFGPPQRISIGRMPSLVKQKPRPVYTNMYSGPVRKAIVFN